MIGQHHQFHHYNPGKSEFGEERYFKITKRIYRELDNRLKYTKFLAGEKYRFEFTTTSSSLLKRLGKKE